MSASVASAAQPQPANDPHQVGPAQDDRNECKRDAPLVIRRVAQALEREQAQRYSQERFGLYTEQAAKGASPRRIPIAAETEQRDEPHDRGAGGGEGQTGGTAELFGAARLVGSRASFVLLDKRRSRVRFHSTHPGLLLSPCLPALPSSSMAVS